MYLDLPCGRSNDDFWKIAYGVWLCTRASSEVCVVNQVADCSIAIALCSIVAK